MISKSYFRLKKNGEPYSACICRHPELIENYEKAIADKTQIWEVHHRREELYSQKELKERGEYFDVSPEALIFLTKAEHCKIDSACKRRGEAQKGQKKHSEEHKRKMSESMKNRKDQSKRVLCVETGEVFDSVREAERKTGIHRQHISAVCRKKTRYKTAGGYHWTFC